MEVEIGKTFVKEIMNEGKGLVFVYPPYKGTYANVAQQIESEGLVKPSSSDTASLIHEVWKNPQGEYESKILSEFKRYWFWELNAGNLYLPKSNEEINDGVIIEYNPYIANGKLCMNKDSLIKRLCEDDPWVKFIPFGFKVFEQSSKELEKNAYVVARYGEEAATKIAEVASHYKNFPNLYMPNSTDVERVTMSALDDYLCGNRLVVIGSPWFQNDGLAFGKVQ